MSATSSVLVSSTGNTLCFKVLLLRDPFQCCCYNQVLQLFMQVFLHRFCRLKVVHFFRIRAMTGYVEGIRLREFNVRNPQISLDEVNRTHCPRTGRTVQGLFVCQVGRIHPQDPQKRTYVPREPLNLPTMADVKRPVSIGPWNPFETTHQRSFRADRKPLVAPPS